MERACDGIAAAFALLRLLGVALFVADLDRCGELADRLLPKGRREGVALEGVEEGRLSTSVPGATGIKPPDIVAVMSLREACISRTWPCAVEALEPDWEREMAWLCRRSRAATSTSSG